MRKNREKTCASDESRFYHRSSARRQTGGDGLEGSDADCQLVSPTEGSRHLCRSEANRMSSGDGDSPVRRRSPVSPPGHPRRRTSSATQHPELVLDAEPVIKEGGRSSLLPGRAHYVRPAKPRSFVLRGFFIPGYMPLLKF